MFKGFYIIWPSDLVFNWVKVILAILVEDHPNDHSCEVCLILDW